eukprot:12927490-Alexandrium_andersonii.AAC.1
MVGVANEAAERIRNNTGLDTAVVVSLVACPQRDGGGQGLHSLAVGLRPCEEADDLPDVPGAAPP